MKMQISTPREVVSHDLLKDGAMAEISNFQLST
jgi:hypothetical protein